MTVAETEDFTHCINFCGLEDKGFKGSKIPGGMEELMGTVYLKGWIGLCAMVKYITFFHY